MVRLASPDGRTRYRRELLSHAPQPAQDVLPGGVDVRGWAIESSCAAQEGLRDAVECNVTVTVTSEER